MVNAQDWLDESYPKNRRNEITELDISKGKVKRWPSHERTLKGDLKLEGFTNLRTLKCFGHELTNLDVSECNNLRELDCHNNELNSLIVDSCVKLEKINCFFNNFLEEVNISNCPKLTEIGSGFTRDNENGKLVKVSQITLAGENDIRNILIVGMTGSGKSTLANVLTDTNQFRSESLSVSVTENFQKSDVFEWKGKKYCVIDNVGFGDTNNLSKADLLYKIGQGIYSARQGINQVLFVFRGRFSDKQIKAFNMFKDFIAESGITKFTTIVRTKFINFKESQECSKDQQNLLNQNKELSEIMNSCKGIMHVDNPPIPTIEDDDDDEMEVDDDDEIIANKRDREDSREKVLDYLAENCQEIYKLKNWDCIYRRVSSYMEQIGEKEKELARSDNNLEKDRLQSEIKSKKEKVVKEINAELTAEFSLLPKLIAKMEFKDINMPWKK